MPSKHSRLSPRSLNANILDSLNAGEMSQSFEEALVTSDKTYVKHKDETEYWDYKEEIDFDNPHKVAQLAKLVLGFHNSKGGVLIYGVTDNFRVCGIYESKILDTIRLIGKLRKYIGSSVPIFQNRISCCHPDKIIWLIFVPKRQGTPVPCHSNGPNDKSGVPIIKKDQYFIRVNDEVKVCIDPNDYERLFSGITFKHLHGYSYEVDDAYFRLLAPHHSQFIGRSQLLEQVKDALSPNRRSYIVALEGVGGVGKSALAIELVRRLYKAGNYQFIVSLSAKNRVWHTHTETRQAGFSGFTELVIEIAKVLDIETSGKTLENLRQDVLAIMEGTQGLLLIDNVEEIVDAQVFEFLKVIPTPVKVLLTSRVRRYLSLPAESIFVPEMDREEARSLLEIELARAEYYDYINEKEEMEAIINASGCLPLAIKWAASLAGTYSSLRQVSSQLRSENISKQEFLDFCYATMYNELTKTAQNVAILCPYLGEHWNVYNLSIGLDESEDSIKTAIDELEDKGLLSRTISSHSESLSMLPLTFDFLSNKWHENGALRLLVQKRIIEALASGNFFSLPTEEKIKLLYERALEHEADKDYDQGLRLVKLALQYITEKEEESSTKLRFMEGKFIYLSQTKSSGIRLMINSLNNSPNKGREYPDYQIFLAQALLSHGESKYENEALVKVTDYINDSQIVSETLIKEFCSRVINQEAHSMLRVLMARAKRNDYAYWIAKTIWNNLDDSRFVFAVGEPLVGMLTLASKSELATEVEKKNFRSRGDKIKTEIKKYKKDL